MFLGPVLKIFPTKSWPKLRVKRCEKEDLCKYLAEKSHHISTKPMGFVKVPPVFKNAPILDSPTPPPLSLSPLSCQPFSACGNETLPAHGTTTQSSTSLRPGVPRTTRSMFGGFGGAPNVGSSTWWIQAESSHLNGNFHSSNGTPHKISGWKWCIWNYHPVQENPKNYSKPYCSVLPNQKGHGFIIYITVEAPERPHYKKLLMFWTSQKSCTI